MSRKTRYGILFAVISGVVFAAVGAAHEVSIVDRTKIGKGSELKPGAYRVEVVRNQDACEVLFYKSGDLMVRAPASVTTESRKAKETEIHFEQADGGQRITRMQLQGSKDILVFNETSKTE